MRRGTVVAVGFSASAAGSAAAVLLAWGAGGWGLFWPSVVGAAAGSLCGGCALIRSSRRQARSAQPLDLGRVETPLPGAP